MEPIVRVVSKKPKSVDSQSGCQVSGHSGCHPSAEGQESREVVPYSLGLPLDSPFLGRAWE